MAALEDELLDALQDYSPSSHTATIRSLRIIRGRHRAALRLLCACGYIERSDPISLIALGPRMSLWSEVDIAALRAEHHRLPAPDQEEPDL